MSDLENQEYTPDQLKQVEFLQTTLLHYDDGQDSLYKDLSTKVTFLFGFVVAALTIYGTYATHVNKDTKYLALVAFGFTAIFLCLALQNRKYKRPPLPDINVSESTYFDKIYKNVTYLNRICIRNKEPLRVMAKWVRFSIYAFIVGTFFVVLSFLVSPKFVIHLAHGQHSKTQTTHSR